jgi:hypothetical protein
MEIEDPLKRLIKTLIIILITTNSLRLVQATPLPKQPKDDKNENDNIDSNFIKKNDIDYYDILSDNQMSNVDYLEKHEETFDNVNNIDLILNDNSNNKLINWKHKNELDDFYYQAEMSNNNKKNDKEIENRMSEIVIKYIGNEDDDSNKLSSKIIHEKNKAKFANRIYLLIAFTFLIAILLTILILIFIIITKKKRRTDRHQTNRNVNESSLEYEKAYIKT